MSIDWLIPIGPNENDEHVNVCLRSIYAQISIENDGLIIVCESDQWSRYIQPPSGLECMLVKPPLKKNASSCRNVGLGYIKRPFVIFQDSDDIAMSCRRSAVLSAIVSADLVCSGYYIIDEQGAILGQRSLHGSNEMFFFRNNIPLPTLALKSELLIGMEFDENLSMGEDNELIGRLLKKGVVVKRLDAPTIKYRVIRSKHGYRTGYIGVSNELKYRTAMIKYSNAKQSMLLIVGAAVCIAVKLLPRSWFDIVHRYSHGGRV